MNIKILGWYNHGNTGDEAYKLAFPLLFPPPQYQIEFVEKIDDDNKSNTDAIILGGGDVFYPSFTQYLPALSSPNVNIKKVAASISLTENSDFPSLKLFDKVVVRDYRSLDWCDKNGISGIYLPDATFMLTPDADAGYQWIKDKFEAEGHALYTNIVVCVISNYLANGKLNMLGSDLTSFLNISQEIAKTADSTNASFVFLPFSTKAPWDDRVSNAWVADRCKYYDKNLVIWDRLDVQTTINIIAAAHVTVSSRLHASIFSTISGVPFIDITRHTKNLGFIETIRKTDWSIPFDDFDARYFRNRINSLINLPRQDPYLLNFTKLAKEDLSVATIL